jgi:hypothetical protein
VFCGKVRKVLPIVATAKLQKMAVLGDFALFAGKAETQRARVAGGKGGREVPLYVPRLTLRVRKNKGAGLRSLRLRSGQAG